MPSVSQKQANLMSAIAHGWRPAHSAHQLPPLAVAQEFHAADKKVGKYEHPRRKATGGPLGNEVTFAEGGPTGYNGYWGGGPYDAQASFYGGGTTGNTAYFGEGGKVEDLTKVLDFLERGKGNLMGRIEGAFHNPYAADPDELRGLISKYWNLAAPEKVAAPVPPPAVPGHASGGPVAPGGSSGGAMDTVTSAVDRAAIGLMSQLQGERGGKAAWTTDPGILEEAKATPDYMLGLLHSAVDLGAPLSRLAAKYLPPVPVLSELPRMLNFARGEMDRQWAHGNPAPAWSRAAAHKAQAIQRAVEASQGVGDPKGFIQNAAQMGGTLLGQIPLLDLGDAADAADGASKAGALSRLLGNDLLEWTTPAMRPSLANYSSGALLGGLAGLGDRTVGRGAP